jgi:predicted amidohydrolase
MPCTIFAIAQSVSVLGDVQANAARHASIAGQAADRGARFILFPELSLVGYDPCIASRYTLEPVDASHEPLRAVARARDITIVEGAPVTFGRGPHIGAFVFSPHGDVDVYTKQFLHPGEQEWFAPGTGGALIPVAHARIGLAVCADATHPEHVCAAVRRGATVYAASCLITEAGYARDASILQRHARQYGVAVLMANHGATTGQWPPAGRSAAWSDQGDLLASTAGPGEALILIEHSRAGWWGRVLAGPPTS